jgi:hypothetical protein
MVGSGQVEELVLVSKAEWCRGNVLVADVESVTETAQLIPHIERVYSETSCLSYA